LSCFVEREIAMSYRLVILGILAERAYYGYELKQTIERQHFAEYVRLSGGGLYYHLRKLREAGDIEEQTVEHEGKYPDRHIYRITQRGRNSLLALLRATLDDVAGRRVYDPLDAALAFAHLVPREEVLARLHHQLDAVYGQLVAMEVTHQLHQRVLARTADRASSPTKSESRYAHLLIDHNLALLQHEERWLQEAIHRIEEHDDFEARDVHLDAAEAGTDAPAFLSDPAFPSAYEIFESRLATMAEILAGYHRQLERAWQDYERQIAAHSDGELAQARQVYQQRMAKIRHAYEEAMRPLHDGAERGAF
jgi:DNA-binding PadR family transcriptional regulator